MAGRSLRGISSTRRSAAGNAQIVLHVNRFFDSDVRQAGAHSKIVDNNA